MRDPEMAALRFHKYEGIGNDFVVVEASSPQALDGASAKRLCDRHFGVGADGVLLVTPAAAANARARMTVINSDGSLAEMCANGLRCVALHLACEDEADQCRYVIETGAGSLGCEVARDGHIAHVQLSLGRARLVGEHSATLRAGEYRFRRISMGNPHAVHFGAAWSEADVDEFAPKVSESFPEGSNVEFAQIIGRDAIELVVWERGVGRTLACGTGAAATVVAAAVEGYVPFDDEVEVRLPGGPLQIQVAADTLAVSLRGPARRVFSGEVYRP